MSKFKCGDFVKFTGDRSAKDDYLSDLEADWSDHMIGEADYANAVRILSEDAPAAVVRIDEGGEGDPDLYYLQAVGLSVDDFKSCEPFAIAEEHLTKV